MRNLDDNWGDSWEESYQIEDEYENNNWNDKSYKELNVLIGFNFEKEVLKDFEEIFLSEKKIVIKENKVYSMDNRRLYCLKEVFEENVKICCKYRKDNQNFRRKRMQAETERKELGKSDNFDYRNIIIDKGRKFYSNVGLAHKYREF
ncbi:hypothetical protein C1645_741192 [Glomus cerebriforme]|uniref:Uncharacterized protein n=1 Tax=Glomus cerebriforme TaxID=658196 RepID=A0A397SM24_9GLOM|nr:hypothetical protein C1645_741192 [Glomus cerebriforme]